MNKKILIFDEETDSHIDLLESFQSILKTETPDFKAVTDMVDFRSSIINSRFDVVLINFQTQVFWDMRNADTEDFVRLIKRYQDPSCVIGGVTGNSFQRGMLEKYGIEVDRKNYNRLHIKKLLRIVEKPITIEEIETIVCDYFKVESQDLHTKSRKRDFVKARQITMYLAKLFLNDVPLKTIGEYFCGRDHTTVVYSRQTVKDQMDTDLNFRFEVQELKEKILYSHY